MYVLEAFKKCEINSYFQGFFKNRGRITLLKPAVVILYYLGWFSPTQITVSLVSSKKTGI